MKYEVLNNSSFAFLDYIKVILGNESSSLFVVPL